MKSTVTPRDEKQVIAYPCLMIYPHTADIVLFTSERVGTVVFKGGNSGNYLGKHYSEWGMESAEPFHGTVTLEND